MPAIAALLPLLLITPTLTIEARAVSVGKLLSNVSAKTGLKLEASPTLAHEIVAANVTGVEVGDFKARLANALGATWETERGTEYLKRTQLDERELWNQHLELRLKLVREELTKVKDLLNQPFEPKKLAAALASLPDRSSAKSVEAMYALEARQKALFQQGANMRFLYRLVLACKPEDLAAIGPYERAVFTPFPTSAQRSIDPKAYAAAAALFRQEQADWNLVAASYEFNPNDGYMVSDPRAQGQMKVDPERVALEISRGDMAALLLVNLVQQADDIIFYNLSQATLADNARRYLDEFHTLSAGEQSVPVDWSSQTKALIEGFTRTLAERQPADETLLALISKPSHLDPLSFAPVDVLSQYARSKKANLLAVLPDSSLSVTWIDRFEKKATLSQAMNYLNNVADVALQEESGWVVIAPRDRYEARLAFTKRDVLERLLSRMITKGTMDVVDYAEYAFESGRRSRLGLGETIAAMVNPEAMGVTDRSSWPVLQLYGSLSPEHRLGIERGARLPISSTSPIQKEIVRRIVFSAAIRNEEAFSAGSYRMGRSVVEPTERYPSALPGNAILTGSSAQQVVIAAYGKGKDGKVRPMRNIDPWTLAHMEDVKQNPKELAGYGVPGLVGYAPSTNKSISLKIELEPGVWKGAGIVVSSYDPEAKPVPWAQLPRELADAVRSSIQQLKEQKERQQSGRNIPPSW